MGFLLSKGQKQLVQLVKLVTTTVTQQQNRYATARVAAATVAPSRAPLLGATVAGGGTVV